MASGTPVDNPILLADCYKVSHHRQYPPGTTSLYAYFESRGGKFPYTVFFGLQYILKRWLVGPVITKEAIQEAKEIYSTAVMADDIFNEEGWNYILEKHGGRLPLRIKAVPEGSVVPVKNVLFTVESTDPAVPWVTGYFEVRIRQTATGNILPLDFYTRVAETAKGHPQNDLFPDHRARLSLSNGSFMGINFVLSVTFRAHSNAKTILVQAWYPMTVATNSRILKQLIHHYNNLSSDDFTLVPFGMHDTGYRGVSSVESAAIGGAAHMVNFQASDTIAGSCMLRKYYHVKGVAAFSGAFSEHSTVTTWGREGEKEAHKSMLEMYSGRRVGCVVDSYNIWDCLENTIGKDLKDMIVEHGKKGGMLCIRPDSGDPTEVMIKCLEITEKAFGSEKNSKGYKVLPGYVKIIQADGVSYTTLASMLKAVEGKGWAASNVSFGAGAALLQRMDRDTQRCAYKCSLAVIDGKEVEVYKQPITDPGKNSKRGRLALHLNDGVYTTVKASESTTEQDQLVTVFENGELLKDYTFDEVRKRADISDNDIDILKFIEADAAKK